ncbi:MAG: hypothetical protein QXX99_06615 [Candidatus Bathyarchaeia archaeon]
MGVGQIRLRYSGFILFAFRLASVGTSLLFTLMITRSISPEEYGIFGNFGDVVSYFTLASTIVPFWVTRFVARGHPGSSKTGLVANLLVAALSAMIYLSALGWIMGALQIGREHFIFYLAGVALIFAVHLSAVLEAILYSKRPETLGFGLFVFEISRVFLGFLIILIFRLGLIGILFSHVTATLIQSIFYLRLLLREFVGGIRWDYVRVWLKGSLLNVHGIISGRILTLANIFLFIYCGELSRAYYGASSAMASIIGYSSSLAFALYPKLLSGAEAKDAELSLKMVLMFAIPMSLGAIVLSEEILLILGQSYGPAWLALTILALNMLVSAPSSVFDSVISGIERLDADAKISYRRVVRSRLFLLLTLYYVQAAIVTPLSYLIFSSMPLYALTAVVYLAIISTIANIIVTLAKYVLARRCLKFSIPWVSIVKYLSVSLIMALILCLLQTPARLTITVAKTLFGGLVYFFILLAVDRETREIARLVVGKASKMLNEIGLVENEFKG